MQTVPGDLAPATRNGHGSLRSEQLVCIVAGTLPPHPAELLASKAFQEFLDEVGDVCDVASSTARRSWRWPIHSS
jgi:hypothetical protein